jgi:hypothetical protein
MNMLAFIRCAFLSICAMIAAPDPGIVQRESSGQGPSMMATPASPVSLELFLKRHRNEEFLSFPEKRENAIRLFDGIPEIWTERKPDGLDHFEAQVQPGEYFVFQIGVFAHRKDLRGLGVKWTDLHGPSTIKATNITCFNTTGTDFKGSFFEKSVDVPLTRVQPLWFGVQIPPGANGQYRSKVTLTPANAKPLSVDILLTVKGKPVKDGGFDTGKNLSRLAWVNATLGTDDQTTKDFGPVARHGRQLRILGRTLDLGPYGLPSQINTYFEPSNQFLVAQASPLLNSPFRFVVEREDGSVVGLEADSIRFTDETPSAVAWRATSSSLECELICSGRLEFDGFMDYELTLRARKAFRIKDIRLEIPVRREKARYMMGLNCEGGFRPPVWRWQWDTTKNQDMLWLGDVSGGLRVKWKAENYVRPLINIYYAYGPLHLPPSWGNGGKGGVRVEETGGAVLVSAFSGTRAMTPGQSLHYDCEVLITPVKVIDTNIRWGDRYFHGGGTSAMRKIAMADSVGANIVNIHHAEDIYPFINYPYLDENVPALRQLVDNAHRAGKRLKVYYTTRELTKNLPEFWALFSLKGEIIYPGPGNACSTIINPKGPDTWLKTNLKERYIPAWLNVIKEGPFAGETDLSVITTPDSRLNNFYLGGLDWMLNNLGIDGVYIDDSALDRLTLRRARKLIDHYRPQGRIDFHSWNHFNHMAGYTSCLNLYMDLLPYVDLVWIGEGRDYDRMPDHWLVEVSGIPFGVTGQMLNGGGNPWRGMVYGITNRPGWAGNPSEIWKFWDAHHISSMPMVGYWDTGSPVSSSNSLVKPTLYKGTDQSIIAIACWGTEDQTFSLAIDWKKLGYDSSACIITIPAIPDFQDERTLGSFVDLNVPAGKGYLMVVEKTK